jgi:hypothetical protein
MRRFFLSSALVSVRADGMCIGGGAAPPPPPPAPAAGVTTGEDAPASANTSASCVANVCSIVTKVSTEHRDLAPWLSQNTFGYKASTLVEVRTKRVQSPISMHPRAGEPPPRYMLHVVRRRFLRPGADICSGGAAAAARPRLVGQGAVRGYTPRGTSQKRYPGVREPIPRRPTRLHPIRADEAVTRRSERIS